MLLTANQFHRYFIKFYLFIFLLNSSVLLTFGQGENNSVRLIQGQTLEQELSGGKFHSYQIKLAANQYLKIIVEQKGIDVVVELYLPGGKKLLEVDSPNGTNGPEPVEFITETGGDYLLKVRSPEEKVLAGRYEIRVLEIRDITEKDKHIIAANKAIQEAAELRRKRTAEASKNAIGKYEEAITHLQAIGDKKQEATILTNISHIYNLFGDTTKYIDYTTQALKIRQEIQDHVGEAESLNNLAVGKTSIGEKEKALELFNQALQLTIKFKLPLKEASTRNNIGDFYGERGDIKIAAKFFNEALAIWRTEKDKTGEAKTLGNLAILYLKANDYLNARDYFTQALNLSRERRDVPTELTSLAYLGDVNRNLGDLEKALESYQAVQTKAHELGARPLELAMLNNIGSVYQFTGQLKLAIDYHTKALNLSLDLKNERSAASAYHHLAILNQDSSELQKALDFNEKSLEIYRKLNYLPGIAEGLNNTGIVYQELGDLEKALEYFNQAFALFEKLDHTRGKANMLNSFGTIYESRGNFNQAIESYERALPLWQKARDLSGEAVTLRNLGAVYSLDLNQQEKALTYFQKALTLSREAKDLDSEAGALHRIGTAYYYANELDKSLEYLNQALEIKQKIQDRIGEGDIRYTISRAEIKRENYQSALVHAERTINIVEEIRSKVRGQKLRATFFALIQKYYWNYIDILMLLHQKNPNEDWLAKAFEANERARARGLLELLSEANVNIKEGVDENLLETERDLQHRISIRTDARIRLLNRKHTAEEEEKINREIKDLTDELEKVESQIRTASPRYAALTQPQPITLAEIQKKVLDAETILLEYTLGVERSYLWVVTQNSIHSYQLPKAAEIKESAESLLKIISTRPTDATNLQYQSAARKLSEILLKPAAKHLSKNKRLLIVGDGILQNIPFAALTNPADGQTPLVIDHEIVSLPSASTLAALRDEKRVRPAFTKEIMVVADPVFELTDLRLKQSSETKTAVSPKSKDRVLEGFLKTLGDSTTGSIQPLPRLFYTRREAQAIAALVPKNQSDVYLDFDANFANATNSNAGQYRFIHFATHGLLNNQQPELTGILFSMLDEKGNPQPKSLLRLGEVYNLKMPAELVVLSGCQTAIGKELKGEGLIGLTRGFMYAGSPRVAASLWKIDDAMTAEMMKYFYEAMLVKKLPPAAALREAQKQMIRQKTAPFYWAAFIMQGEWR
jgi:CHAT domain-containing protein/Tfp pilus assembly protein PilF